MFTGLIQQIGIVDSVTRSGSNVTLNIQGGKLTKEIAVGDSVALSGVCLTATEVNSAAGLFSVTAVTETVKKTTLGGMKRGDRLNLELAMKSSDRLGGHFVQGHVDAVGHCTSIRQLNGSWLLRFSHPQEFDAQVIERGSISVDGVSLTAIEVADPHFSVSIIPHTMAETTLQFVKPNDQVNLEFDLIGKYVASILSRKGSGTLTMAKMAEYGYY